MNIIIFLIAILFTLVAHWMLAQRIFSVDKHINKLKTSILAHLHIHEKRPVVMVLRNISKPTHYHFQIKGPPQINRHTSDL